MNENMSFEEEFDKTLAEVLALSDEELLNLPANPALERVFENFERMNEAYLESQGYIPRLTIRMKDIGGKLDNYQNKIQFCWPQGAYERASGGSPHSNVAQASEFCTDMSGMKWIWETRVGNVGRFANTAVPAFAARPQDMPVLTDLNRPYVWREPITDSKITGRVA